MCNYRGHGVDVGSALLSPEFQSLFVLSVVFDWFLPAFIYLIKIVLHRGWMKLHVIKGSATTNQHGKSHRLVLLCTVKLT